MDLGVILGLLVAVGSMVGALLCEHGKFGAFVNLGAFIIIAGGVAGATMATVSLKTCLNLPRLVLKAMFTSKKADATAMVERFTGYTQIVRREGMLALEPRLQQEEDPFTRKALQLTLDGLDGGMIVQILEADIEAMEKRHEENYNMFNVMGGYGPTMGIIGTVLGLVNMLMGLGESSEGLGASVAVAFVATLYGVAAANMVFFPIAANLKTKSQTEARFRRVVIEGVLSIQTGENPRLMKEKLLSIAGAKEKAAAVEANA